MAIIKSSGLVGTYKTGDGTLDVCFANGNVPEKLDGVTGNTPGSSKPVKGTLISIKQMKFELVTA